jgi:hypothetical protein
MGSRAHGLSGSWALGLMGTWALAARALWVHDHGLLGHLGSWRYSDATLTLL